MIDIDNETNLNIPLKHIEALMLKYTDKDIDLLIVDEIRMQSINLEHRNIDSPTDVLSFPFENIPMAPLGSLVICTSFVKQVAKELGHSEDEEFCLLFIHGLLHLLGYDHETDEGQMRDKEEEIIKAFNLPQSLIVRSTKG